MNVYAKPLSRDKIRRTADVVREFFGVKNDLKFPVVEIIELLVAAGELDLEIVSEKEMRDTYGVTNTAQNVIRLQENVYEGAVKDNPRDRFTVCHEFAHWILHQPENIGYARGDIPKYCDPEWQANVLAAELLVPHDLVDKMMIKEIADKCKVSYTCADIQRQYY